MDVSGSKLITVSSDRSNNCGLYFLTGSILPCLAGAVYSGQSDKTAVLFHLSNSYDIMWQYDEGSRIRTTVL